MWFAFFFFQRDTHTSACKLFHAALPLETSEETEHSPREYDKQRRETKKKKQLQGYGDNMCHSVYPQYVRVWRGTTFQYRGKGRDSKELVVIQRKKFSLAHRYSSGRTWRGSVASETDADFFFIYLERKNEEEAMWCFYSFPREPQLSLHMKKNNKSLHMNTAAKRMTILWKQIRRDNYWDIFFKQMYRPFCLWAVFRFEVLTTAHIQVSVSLSLLSSSMSSPTSSRRLQR